MSAPDELPQPQGRHHVGTFEPEPAPLAPLYRKVSLPVTGLYALVADIGTGEELEQICSSLEEQVADVLIGLLGRKPVHVHRPVRGLADFEPYGE